ncbi:MAG: nitrogen fixation protein NifU [Chloroflexota bacterium]|nr:nitrogen fixation protein NifU [Chloroflexota bacterium]
MVDDLYRRVVLDRYQAPVHRGPLADANATASAHNPLCGDEITVRARVEDGHIAEVAWEALGCSIVHASADMMADEVQGRQPDAIPELVARVGAMLAGSDEAADALGEIGVFRSVRRYPARVKCALLPWKTLAEALAASHSEPRA